MADPEAISSDHLDQSVEIGTLCAFYGCLLTKHQLEAVRLHYMEDFSFGEIAEMQNTTRQNIHDMIMRSVQKLRDWEEKLGMAQKSFYTANQLRQIQSAVSSGNSEEAQKLLAALILYQEGDDREHGI